MLALDARDQKRIALQELDDAEALLALAHGVMAAIGSGDIANNPGDRANCMKIGGAWLIDRGIALHQETDRTLGAERLLRGRDRAGPPEGDRRDESREQRNLAHRHDHHRIRRERLHRAEGTARNRERRTAPTFEGVVFRLIPFQ